MLWWEIVVISMLVREIEVLAFLLGSELRLSNTLLGKILE
jgi:hypothetical protein